MCTVSMVGDHYRDIWEDKPWYPNVQPYVRPLPPVDPGILPWRPPAPAPAPFVNPCMPAVSREEFDELKRQVNEMVLLLKRAKMYDEQNNEPHCEMAEKMDLLRKVAKLVGIDLDDVLKPKE